VNPLTISPIVSSPQCRQFWRRKDGKSDAETSLNPPCADLAPSSERLTAYDKGHLITYLRLLDADAAGLDWAEASRVILYIDPRRQPDRARRAYDSHLKRAQWMTERGFRYLLEGA
jgi:hypothetical protein